MSPAFRRRPSVTLACALVAAVAGCGGGTAGGVRDAGSSVASPSSPAAGSDAPPGPTGPRVTVLSYNVNYGLGGDAEGVAAIREADADLVLLQETTPAWADALRRGLGERYPHMLFRDCCGAGGLGVLSKQPFEAKDYAHAKEAWFPALRLVAQSPIGPLQVLAVHLHPQISNGGSVVSGVLTTSGLRESEIAEYFPLLEPGLPTLVGGDFNEGQAGSAVSYLEQRGFRSAQAEQSKAVPTWQWPTSVGTIRAEFDHLMHDARLALREVRVLAAGRSDHLPVLGVFGAVPSA